MHIKKEVTLLTGFLGAGKTTVLNAIISAKKDTRFAVIENELGAESIDAALIVKSEDDIMELNNGCLCCSLNDHLYDLLNGLWERKDSWDHLVIEATGIADPANIAHPFLTSEQIKRSYLLKRVICVVDSELIEDQLKGHPEAIKQIAFSDVILLNKIEQLNENSMKELQAILKTVNPFAEVFVASGQDFQVHKMFAGERFTEFHSNLKPAISPKGVFSLGNGISKGISLMASAASHNKHVHSDIETILLKYKESMDIEKLEHRMMVFLIAQSANVHRVKAIIYSHALQSRIILQTVGKSIAITLGEMWLPDEVKESRIVIIGKMLKVYGFDKMFSSCLFRDNSGGMML